jgi:hypothetical protein
MKSSLHEIKESLNFEESPIDKKEEIKYSTFKPKEPQQKLILKY